MMENNYIHNFFAAQSVSERFKALLELTKKRKQIHQAAKNPNFKESLESFFKEALSHESSEEMLIAVAALSRVSSIVKSFRKTAEQIAIKYIIDRLPSPEIMQNPDDRYYIAKTCNTVSAEWVTDYLAQAAIEEESAEKARTEFVKGLLKSAGSLHVAFDMLSQKFIKWSTMAEKPTEAAARRLKRVLSAVHPSLLEYDGEITPDAGESLARMIRAPFRKGIEVLDQDIRKELASEVAETVHNLIRARFSLATVPLTYESIKVSRRWFPDYRWESFARGSRPMQKVTSDLLEGLTLLVRQGITDKAMFERLVILLGSEDNARQKAAELGRSLSSLTDNIRQWLITGRSTIYQKPLEGTDLAVKSAEQRENLLLASLLIDLERLNSRTTLIREECLAKIEMLDPKISKEVSKLIDHTLTVVDGLRSFCTRRGLRIRGNIDDIVEYSPIDHELTVASANGIREVRMIDPVVEKINEDGVPSIVRKGLVEPY